MRALDMVQDSFAVEAKVSLAFRFRRARAAGAEGPD
jgi:hypothetical protein